MADSADRKPAAYSFMIHCYDGEGARLNDALRERAGDYLADGMSMTWVTPRNQTIELVTVDPILVRSIIAEVAPHARTEIPTRQTGREAERNACRGRRSAPLWSRKGPP